MKLKTMSVVALTQRKQFKQKGLFMFLPINKSRLTLTPSVVRGLCRVVDDGCAGSTPIQCPSAEVISGDASTWMHLSITGQDLRVLDCKDPHRSVFMVTVSGPLPTLRRTVQSKTKIHNEMLDYLSLTLQRTTKELVCSSVLNRVPGHVR